LSAASLARERLLPVTDPLAALLPDGGLVRGQVVATRGVAAVSLALGLVVDAVVAGSWLAIVDLPAIGTEAAEELGIPLERVVRVDPGPRGRDRSTTWAELMAAVVDGFEVVVTRIPPQVPAGLARRVCQRVQAKAAVLVVVGSPAVVSPAIELHATHPRWDGVEAGAGYLRGRRVTVTATGRRAPRPRRTELWLPGPDGRIAAVLDPLQQSDWSSAPARPA
jgi:hypothetical protein